MKFLLLILRFFIFFAVKIGVWNVKRCKEEDYVYLKIDNKLCKEISYKVHKIEFEEGGTFYDGFEVKLYAYLENEKTNIVKKFNVAFFSNLSRIKCINAYNIKNFIE